MEFDPDGSGGGPATWILGSAGAGAGSGSSSAPSGIFTPAIGGPGLLKAGMAVYFKAPGVLDLALAVDAAPAAPAAPYQVVGLANAETSGGQAVGMTVDGQLSLTDWTAVVGAIDLVPGARYYLSARDPGQLVLSCPSGVGTSVVSVGQALSERTLEVEINLIARL